ncbi:18477_t:CDS:2 [Acaulospora morrowiae]|uniref:18477_t:CDS:1 n=1 Tax=Acaulospora morrowiae TaxID=94023 RepID=A0A9N8ZL17_9GLOM|nr:18477_t:CDS:2 [Acaulospora morrowiae]
MEPNNGRRNGRNIHHEQQALEKHQTPFFGEHARIDDSDEDKYVSDPENPDHQ